MHCILYCHIAVYNFPPFSWLNLNDPQHSNDHTEFKCFFPVVLNTMK